MAWNELMDLDYEGYPFTWRNNQDARPIQQRLDRGLATMEWHNLYPNTKIRHVALEGSDHAMLSLSTENVKAWRGRKFNYDSRWSKSEECRDLMVGDWKARLGEPHAFRFCEKMKSLRRSLKVWYRGRGRNSQKNIDLLKEEIRVAYNSSDFATVEVKQKESELKAAHKNEEIYWKVKSRNQWLKEGDKKQSSFMRKR